MMRRATLGLLLLVGACGVSATNALAVPSSYYDKDPNFEVVKEFKVGTKHTCRFKVGVDRRAGTTSTLMTKFYSWGYVDCDRGDKFSPIDNDNTDVKGTLTVNIEWYNSTLKSWVLINRSFATVSTLATTMLFKDLSTEACGQNLRVRAKAIYKKGTGAVGTTGLANDYVLLSKETPFTPCYGGSIMLVDLARRR